MKRDIDGTSTPNIWNLTDQAPVLEIYADQEFDTSGGQTVMQGDPDAGLLCRRFICSIMGGELVIPACTDMDTTEDSPTNQLATYSAYIKAANQQPIPWLFGFAIPPTKVDAPNSINWTALRIHKSGIIARDALVTLSRQQIYDYVELRINTALADAGILAKGIAVMVAGEIQVDTPYITADGNVLATSHSSGVTGTPYVPEDEIVPGASFMLRSTNGADEGNIVWIIFAG